MPRLARTPKAYHHGDLARALLAAAESVLTDRGVEGFTLRECARRAGVSHAAPAHHFGDAEGLLTEVAAVGFDRLTTAQREAATAEPDPDRRLAAIGIAYVRFALTHPAQFRLMFFPGMLARKGERFLTAGRAAFQVLLDTLSETDSGDVAALTPKEAGSDPAVLRQWALVHGIATLAIEGQLGNNDRSSIPALLRHAREVLEHEGPEPATAKRRNGGKRTKSPRAVRTPSSVK